MNPPRPEIVALLNQAMAQLKAGDTTQAKRAIRAAMAEDPASPHAKLAFAMLHQHERRYAEAAQILQTLTVAEPTFFPAWATLGLVRRAEGDLVGSVAALERAHAQNPQYLEAAFNLALGYEDLARPADAIRLYRHVLQAQPNFTPAKTNLGVLARKIGDFALARQYLAALAHEANADAKLNFALLLTDVGEYAEAIALAREATQLAPDDPATWETLGQAALLGGDAEIAVDAFTRATSLAPGNVEALYDLGRAEISCGDVAKGKATLAEALAIKPDYLPALFARELALPPLYQSDAHMAAARSDWVRGIENLEARIVQGYQWPVAQARKAVSTYVPYALHYQDSDTTGLQRRFGKLVETVVGRAFPQFLLPCDWAPMAHGGRLRVGFVSAYLRNHSVGHFFASWITDLDSARFESFVFSIGESEDALTHHIAKGAAHFSREQDIEKIALAIRAAKLDVLIFIDVSMHPHAQVLAAMRLAPIQCAAFGHPITTGLSTVSHFLSAAAAESENADSHYVEKLIRLPKMGLRVRMNEVAARRALEKPSRKDGVQFLCAQRLFKVLPHMDRLIAQILRGVPGSRVAFFASLSPRLNAQFVARISTALRAEGLEPRSVLEMLPVMPHADFLRTMQAATLLLDTTHFSGGNTSFDAFAIGLPVLAYEGAMLRGRQTSAMLEILGVGELIARTDTQYVELACALATSPAKLEELRARISANRDQLFDDDRAIPALEAALQALVAPAAPAKTASLL